MKPAPQLDVAGNNISFRKVLWPSFSCPFLNSDVFLRDNSYPGDTHRICKRVLKSLSALIWLLTLPGIAAAPRGPWLWAVVLFPPFPGAAFTGRALVFSLPWWELDKHLLLTVSGVWIAASGGQGQGQEFTFQWYFLSGRCHSPGEVADASPAFAEVFLIY